MIRKFAIIALIAFFMTQNAFAIRPAKEYIAIPSQSGMAYDSINIPTADHFRLTGWYCKPAVNSGNLLIVLAGGDAGNMSYDLPLAQFLIQNFNVPVLLFDYRGFGSSQAFSFDSSGIGHPEYLTDLDAAVAFARKSNPDRKIIVYGRSLGGSLALVEGAMQTGIAGVIAESPYASQALLTQHMEEKSPGVAIRTIASDSLDPAAHIQNFRAKNLLVMHGANEKYILSNELEKLVSEAPIENKKYVNFPDCDHLEIPFNATQKFGEAIGGFLASCR